MAANILLTRIDNRLVHGQVGVTWTRALGANLILVANDQASKDTLQQKLMATTAESSGAEIRFFSLEKTIAIINKAADRQKIFIVVKTPQDARKLVEGGVPIKEVNVGNMHFSQGKKEITKKVYVNEQDKEDLLYLSSQDIDIYIKDYPGEKKYPITEKLLK
ncbi:PTS galactosamine transporter subunit IIB [Liquorilactobacillus satsumensis]|uniref:PTS family porter n=1 Tax=Liquorilactobacillus satsumensis DSM 16230 = JCM 12392 TaxID=1423801 RepID=A0A0R1V099_9LACO|nr:PTS galactosamine transporter subunit IIB [Liquorilactobacillus satsumensis]KRL99024.1 PTS family porter [Liquorilactobacillus satsumensis DSM 16230 = JCM 12392]MCC7666901.1 PTS N-acetylgalactosamine transporter subunit IIB [Liquorilactobacillus satsumensis]MCP9357183.1 PTS N-acetylgalactosamine transporter subunit IIB [Liquorilactobacillus satsumensis]MCP9371130.1 PTS N-acetylgalactosamine transporter subunit IIB [Liquorilactobacillus satsumensis]